MALFDKDRAKKLLDEKAARERAKRHNILLIDDEVDNLNVLATLLKDEYSIFVAESGQKGLEIIRGTPIDLIITDQRMPEMTGVQFLEKTVQDFPDTMRMILTGFTDVNAIIEAINSGQVYRYITKPWDEKELRLTIKRALERYELGRENRRLVDEVTSKNAALLELNSSLEHKVGERTQELVSVNEKVRCMHREILQRFMSPAVAEKMLAAEGNASSVASVRKNLTIFFSDIRGFSTAADALEPEELCAVLNEYFTEMTTIVYRHGGTLDKFIGDAIMVFFNDPLPQEDHARRAVAMAMEMQQRMSQLKNHWFDKGIENPLSIGMGITTGYVSVGNFGSEQRMDYTIIGNEVNLASRLQSEAKENEILISHRTWVQVKDAVECESLGEKTVKGLHAAVKVYKVIGLRGVDTPQNPAV